MPSPNAGKSPVDQALCVARALMAASPSACDQVVAQRSEVNRLLQEGLFPFDAWYKVVEDEVERYVRISRTGQGESRKTLPEGQTAVLTIDVRGRKPVSQAFADFVEEYEQGVLLEEVFLGLAFGDRKGSKRADLKPLRSAAAQLRKSLDACAPGYSEEKIREFREWLGRTTEQVDVHGQSVPLVKPEHLVAFSRHLAQLRAEHAADKLLFGSVATATQVCIKAAATLDDERARRKAFFQLAWRLVAGDVFHPLRIVNGVIEQAIEDRFVAPLWALADGYWQQARAGISAAQSRTSIDEFLDTLYEAVPRAQGAYLIFARLRENSSRLTQEQAAQVDGILDQVEEELVRLAPHPFVVQISDFDGEDWDSRCRDLGRIMQTEGEKAAKRQIGEMKRLLVYPTPVLNNLLHEGIGCLG